MSPLQRNLGISRFTASNADKEIPFCGSSSYDAHDFTGASHVLVSFRKLPLHLRTLKSAERMLQPYGVVTEVKQHEQDSNNHQFFQCFCWIDTPTSIPTRIKIKVRRTRGNTVTRGGQLALDMFIVHLEVTSNPLQKDLCPVQHLPPVPDFQNGFLDENDIPQCFLQDTEIDDYEKTLLTKSLVLTQVDKTSTVQVSTIFHAIRLLLPDHACLVVKKVEDHSFLVHSYNSKEFVALRSAISNQQRVTLANQVFEAVPWSTTYRGSEVGIGQFVRIELQSTTKGLLQRDIAHHVLSSFTLIEDGYPVEEIHGLWLD